MASLSRGAHRIFGESAFEVLEKAKALEQQGKEILHFEIGEPNFNTPINIAQKGIDGIKNNLTHYVNPTGITELKFAIQTEIKKTRGFSPEMDQIIVTPGAKPALFLAMLALIDSGDEIIIPEPAFPSYRSVASFIGADIKSIPLLEENEFAVDPDDIKKVINSKTKLLIINSPNNPTGSIIDSDAINRIVALCLDNGTDILSDEIYSGIIYDSIAYSPASINDAISNTVVVDGFSKNYAMTGWRLGYMIVPLNMIKVMNDFLVSSLSCTPEFVQMAGVEALQTREETLIERNKELKIKRDKMYRGINDISSLSCSKPLGAYYLFVNIKNTGMTSRVCSDYILNTANIAAVPGTAFGNFGEGYIRFSYATSDENIDMAISRLHELFQ